MPKVSDQWLQSVLGTLYHGRAMTRSAIVRATSLNPASASHALQFLLNRGVILKMGALRSTGGRRRDLLKLNAEVGFFVAVDLEGTRLRFALTNLVGDIRYRWAEDLEFGRPLKVERIVDGISMVLGNLDSSERPRVVAVGLSYPGFIDEEGRITAFNQGWHKMPLLAQLHKTVDLPVFLQQAGRNCILAERWLGVAKDSNNCIYLILGSGVGIGGFVDGKLLDGSNRMAGEFGHITIDPDAKDRCNCGKRGCLEAVVSSPNIVRQYLAKMASPGNGAASCSVAEVFAAARRGDTAAMEVLDRVCKCLGLALSHIALLLNPELLVLGGDIAYGEDVLLPRLKEQVRRHIPAGFPHNFKIKLSSLGLDIGLKGAASFAFLNSLRDPALLGRICTPPFSGMHVAEKKLPARIRTKSSAKPARPAVTRD
jgi:predicted NBD/HSP70 family sugar kinase